MIKCPKCDRQMSQSKDGITHCYICDNTIVEKYNEFNSFKEHPISIGEVKSEKDSDGSLWTPRECLIAMLREIDNGLQCDLLVVSYRVKIDGKYRARFLQSTKDGLASLGLLEATKYKMMD